MAPKLLTPSQAQAQSKRATDAEKHRLVEVQTLITEKYKELSQAETDFAEALLKQQGIWSDYLGDFEKKRDKLKAEVEELEERRKQALIPLTEKAKMLDTKASALDTKEKELALKEDDLEVKSGLLTVKLDEVAERELQADAVAKTLTQREEGIQLQAGQVTRDQALLAIASTDLTNRVNESEHQIALKWASVNAREAQVEERERKAGLREAALAKRERSIHDQYETLQRTIKRTHGTSSPRPK